jgi:hypothetical protein
MDVISGPVDQTSSSEAKIALFRSLFRGRDDVYPRRFESRKTGRSRYAPACANEWVRGVCEKPRVKCAECPKRRFLPVTDDVIRWHLSGCDAEGQPFVAGVYTILLPASVVPGWPADVVLPSDPVWKRDYSGSVRRLIRDGVDTPLASLFVHAARAMPEDAEGSARGKKCNRGVPLPATGHPRHHARQPRELLRPHAPCSRPAPAGLSSVTAPSRFAPRSGARDSSRPRWKRICWIGALVYRVQYG